MTDKSLDTPRYGTRGVPVHVPLRADAVGPPRLVYGGLPLSLGEQEPTFPALYFPMADTETIGRVTFEELDAIRAQRGETLPFEIDDFTTWVYEVNDSSWLAERHSYELTHYQYPLLGAFAHYVFRFHDEFVEAIARGIWLDKPDPSRLWDRPVDDPSGLFPVETPARHEVAPSGIEWELRQSPKAIDVLVERAALCSQRLYQFNLVLDGSSREAASVWLRYRRGSLQSTMTRLWAGAVAARPGVAQPEDFFGSWNEYVEGVAERRLKRGKLR